MYPTPKIAIVLLAAGASKRFGAVKQLLEWENATLIQQAINTINGVPIAEKMVVLGAHANRIQSKTDFKGVTVLVNADWSMGLGKSIGVSVDYLLENHNNIDAILFLLADQPLIDLDYLNTMIGTFNSDTSQIIASSYGGGKKGVPALFGRNYFDELSQLNSDQGAKSIIKKHQKHVEVLDAEHLVFDIDTKEDYAKLRR